MAEAGVRVLLAETECGMKHTGILHSRTDRLVSLRVAP